VGTLGLNEATRALVENLSITGGARGMSLPLFPGGIAQSSRFFYTAFLITALTMLLITWTAIRRPFGYACRAIRADEEAAASLGVPTTRTKTIAWTASAVAMGLCGSLHAYWLSYIDPQAAFDMGIAIKFFLMMLVGGVGTLVGPIIGAVFVELAATAVWSRFIDYHVGALGLIMIVVVLTFPGGFVAFVADRVRRARVLLGRGGP
jgi:branched-chain amino acid transport system permease protein